MLIPSGLEISSTQAEVYSVSIKAMAADETRASRGFANSGYALEQEPRAALADSLALGYYRSAPAGLV
jgi:hypothetical protein